MKRLMILALLIASPSYAKTNNWQDVPIAPARDMPVKTELDKVMKQLSEQVKIADGIAMRLKDTAQRKPEDVQAEVRQTAQALANLTDRLAPTGDIANQLQAVRNAAAIHLKRVQELPKDAMEEEDRTKVGEAWKDVLRGADVAQSSMQNIRTGLMSALTHLRMRSTAISEMLLANQYQEAITAFTRWILELDTTVKSLHELIGTPGS